MTIERTTSKAEKPEDKERDAQIRTSAESFEPKKENSKVRGLIRKKLRNSYFVTKSESSFSALSTRTLVRLFATHSFIHSFIHSYYYILVYAMKDKPFRPWLSSQDSVTTRAAQL